MKCIKMLLMLSIVAVFTGGEVSAQITGEVSYQFPTSLQNLIEDPSQPVYIYLGRTKYKVAYSVIADNDVFDSKKRISKKPTQAEFDEMKAILLDNGYDENIPTHCITSY